MLTKRYPDTCARRERRCALALLLALLLIALPAFPASTSAPASRNNHALAAGHAPQTGSTASGVEAALARAQEDYGNLPLSFEANYGQTDARVDFITRASGATVFLMPAEAVFVLSAPAESAAATTAAEGSSAPLATGRETVLASPRLHALRNRGLAHS